MLLFIILKKILMSLFINLHTQKLFVLIIKLLYIIKLSVNILSAYNSLKLRKSHLLFFNQLGSMGTTCEPNNSNLLIPLIPLLIPLFDFPLSQQFINCFIVHVVAIVANSLRCSMSLLAMSALKLNSK